MANLEEPLTDTKESFYSESTEEDPISSSIIDTLQNLSITDPDYNSNHILDNEPCPLSIAPVLDPSHYATAPNLLLINLLVLLLLPNPYQFQ